MFYIFRNIIKIRLLVIFKKGNKNKIKKKRKEKKNGIHFPYTVYVFFVLPNLNPFVVKLLFPGKSKSFGPFITLMKGSSLLSSENEFQNIIVYIRNELSFDKKFSQSKKSV